LHALSRHSASGSRFPDVKRITAPRSRLRCANTVPRSRDHCPATTRTHMPGQRRTTAAPVSTHTHDLGYTDAT